MAQKVHNKTLTESEIDNHTSDKNTQVVLINGLGIGLIQSMA